MWSETPGTPFKRLAIEEKLLEKSTRQPRYLVRLEELIMVVGVANTTRTTVFDFGPQSDLERGAREGYSKNNMWFPGWWGRGGSALQEKRVKALSALMAALKEHIDKKDVVQGKKIPLVKVMVLAELDWPSEG